MAELRLDIYQKSITVDEHRKLRAAVDLARQTGEITHLVASGRRGSAIVPEELVRFAIEHGWEEDQS